MALSNPSEGLNFQVGVTDATQAGFARITSRADAFAKTVKQKLQQVKPPAVQAPGLDDRLKNVGRAFEPVEKLGKLFTVAQSAGVAFQGISAAVKGDWDGVGDALRQLPFGIGQLSGFAQDFKAEITGAKDELIALGEEAKRIDRESAFAERRNKHFRGILDGFKASIQAEERALALGGNLSASRKMQLEIEFDLQDVDAQLQAALKEQERLGAGPLSNAAKILRQQADSIKQIIRQSGARDIADALGKESADQAQQVATKLAKAAAEHQRAWKESLGKFRLAFGGLEADAGRLGDAMGRLFGRVRSAAGDAAQAAADRFKLVTDRLRDLRTGAEDASRALRGLIGGRQRRDFELELAQAGGNVFEERRIRLKRAEQLAMQAGRAKPEEAAGMRDEALGLVMDLLAEFHREGAPRRDVRQLEDLRGDLENAQERAGQGAVKAANLAVQQGEQDAAAADKVRQLARIEAIAKPLEDGAGAARDLMAEGGRVLFNWISKATGKPIVVKAQQGAAPNWADANPFMLRMAPIEQMNRLLLNEVGN